MQSIIRNKLVWLVAIITITAVIYIIQYDRIQIKKTINTAIDGIETARVDLVISAISADYHDSLGYVRSDLRDTARDAFQKIHNIRVRILEQDIQVADQNAVVDIQFRVVADYEQMRGWILGTPQNPANVSVSLKKEKNGWMITAIKQTDPFF